MENDLYRPTLNAQNTHHTESYDVGKLFLVAFFGGTIAISALSVINARWLKISQTTVTLMIIAAVVVLGLKMGAYYGYMHEILDWSRQSVRYSGRALDLALFGGFYFTMNKAFRSHLVLNGETKPMLRDAIVWIIISVVIEYFMISMIGMGSVL